MISSIKQQVESLLLESGAVLLPEDCYTNMKYPKVLPIMRFRVDQYSVQGFGHVMLMHTTTKMGMDVFYAVGMREPSVPAR